MTQVMIVQQSLQPQDRVEVAATQKSNPRYAPSTARWRTSPPATILLSSMDLPSKGTGYQTELFHYLKKEKQIKEKKGEVKIFVVFACFFVSSFIHSFIPSLHAHRSLSELEGIRVGGDMGEKIRQVTERATLFRITSNAMINVSHPVNQFLRNTH